MTQEEIYREEVAIELLPSGQERWVRKQAVQKAIIALPTAKCDHQELTFREWMKALEEPSKKTHAVWSDDKYRADYYENNPENWIFSYESGSSPEEAVQEDMEAW